MGTSATKKKGEGKPVPKAGKRKTFEEASAHVRKQYAETFAKLAK